MSTKIENFKNFSGDIDTNSQKILQTLTVPEIDIDTVLRDRVEVADLYDGKHPDFEYEITPQISDSLIEVGKFVEKLDIESDNRYGRYLSIRLQPVSQKEYNNFLDNIDKVIKENQNNPELLEDLIDFKADMQHFYEKGYLVSGLDNSAQPEEDGKVIVPPEDYYPTINMSTFYEDRKIYKLFHHSLENE